MEEGVPNRQAVFCTEPKEEESVGVADSNSMFAEDDMPEMLIVTDSGVEVAKDDQFHEMAQKVAMGES